MVVAVYMISGVPGATLGGLEYTPFYNDNKWGEVVSGSGRSVGW